MATIKRYLHASIVALCLATAAPARAADPEARARAHYDRAVELFTEGNYPAALLELQRAGELRPSYKLFHSIAQVHAAMNDPAAALDAYRKYLDQGGQRISPERRREVSAEMATLARRVATVTVSADVPGAEVWVDDTRVGTTPLRGPLALNAGQHRVSVRHPDYPGRSVRVTAVGGGTERVDLSLRGEEPRGAAASRAPGAAPMDDGSPATELPGVGSPELARVETDAASDESSLKKHAWVGWVATGVLAAGATATGLWALSKDASLEEAREDASTPGGPSRAELESSASSVRTLATATDVLWIAAAAAGGISLWLTFGSSKAGEREASAGRPLRMLVNASGVSLDGRF